MPRRKPRSLRPDEVELWHKVVEKTTPLHPDKPAPDHEQFLVPPKKLRTKPYHPAAPSFRIGETAKPLPPRHDTATSISDHIASQPVAMDQKRFSDLKKGRLRPEGRIDLHGMTIAQAHPRLNRFILDAVAEGRRLVLVITGKGKSRIDHGPIPERPGVLRHQVPHWLHTAPLKQHILQITEAHIRHGGQGAYYVYLRRPR